MKRNEEIVAGYYDEWAEEKRLTRDKAHMVEFYITMNYIEKYLKSGDKVLEVGCGTGIYTLEIAKKGYDITAFDISNKNIEILKSKITDDMNVKVSNSNVTEMFNLSDHTYDVSLVLGPLYHLFSKEDIDKAIMEAKRVTKIGGHIFFAFLSQDYIMMRKCEDVFQQTDKYLTSTFDFVSNLEEAFYYFKISDFQELIQKHKLNKVHMLTMDGITGFIEDKINNLSDEGYQNYINYLMANCERIELMGFSPHLLYITQNL